MASSETALVLLGTSPQRKLTLPHDANCVVQNKKGTKPKPKKKIQNTHKGDGAPYTLLNTLPFLAVVCAFARLRHSAAEPRMLKFRID